MEKPRSPMNGAVSDSKAGVVTLDSRPVAKRIGLIVLATDHTSERDFARVCDPDEVGVYASRIAYENPTTPENLSQMGPRLSQAADLILPGEPVDVVAYACTAASVVLGNDTVFDAIRAAKPGAACVTPSTAAFDAFDALGIRRVSVLTPYTDRVTGQLVDYFGGLGLDIVNHRGLGFDDDREMARIDHTSLLEAGANTISEDADALFVSCTAVRAMECISRLEDRIGKPVISSNQALVWRSLRLVGVSRRIQGFGRLFEY